MMICTFSMRKWMLVFVSLSSDTCIGIALRPPAEGGSDDGLLCSCNKCCQLMIVSW